MNTRETEIDEQRRLAQAVLDASLNGIYVYDVAKGENILINEQYTRLTGHGTDELKAMSADEFFSLYHPDDREAVAEHMARLAEVGDDEIVEIRYRFRKADNTWMWCRSRDKVFRRDADGKLQQFIGSFVDITDHLTAEYARQSLEAQLRQQQKFESIGTLAGGVAHEINNPINGIMNYAQLIADAAEPGSPAAEYGREIVSETERVATIVRSLLSFARQEKESHSAAAVVDIIKGTLSLIRTILRRDQITIEVHTPDDLPNIKCRSQQIQQVLMNLLTNARDALNERYPGYHPDKIIRVAATRTERDGQPWVRITVEDQGTGVPPAIAERMFDPFFTTKPKELGTGLGLPISHGIVTDHGGEIGLESTGGASTQFYVELPVDNGWRLGET